MRQALLGITSDREGLTYEDILEASGQWLEVMFFPQVRHDLEPGASF